MLKITSLFTNLTKNLGHFWLQNSVTGENLLKHRFFQGRDKNKHRNTVTLLQNKLVIWLSFSLLEMGRWHSLYLCIALWVNLGYGCSIATLDVKKVNATKCTPVINAINIYKATIRKKASAFCLCTKLEVRSLNGVAFYVLWGCQRCTNTFVTDSWHVNEHF